MADTRVTELAPRIASTRLVTTFPIESSASRTRTLVTIGKAAATSLISLASLAAVELASVSVAMSVWGAPTKAFGE